MRSFDPEKKLGRNDAEYWERLFSAMIDAGVSFVVATAQENEGFVPRVRTGVLFESAELEPYGGDYRVELRYKQRINGVGRKTLIGDTFFINDPRCQLVSVCAKGSTSRHSRPSSTRTRTRMRAKRGRTRIASTGATCRKGAGRHPRPWRDGPARTSAYSVARAAL